ncbi:MAG TPA: ATP-dependent helicase [Acidimicrobiales bacterium]|nr:ATP-dependent helicase [Acidimicrobiales bacterium]
MFATTWDDGLTEAQLLAVSHADAPLVVVAGAGTGKTRTLTARVARLLERGVAPERVLLLTFTRRAADDMLSRAAALVGRPDLSRRLRGGTFHAVAHQLVSAWGHALGICDGFTVLDLADATDVMDMLREEHGLTGSDMRLPTPSTLVDVYSRCVNTTRTVAEVVSTDFPWCEPHVDAIGALCRAYVERKRSRSQLDFDDLLLYLRAALSDPAIGAEIAGMFDYVLVDEYQDVNSLQVDIVRALRPAGRGLTVVGDDAQAIYGFRGASPAHLHALAGALTDATVVQLEENFRSVQPILDVANHVRPELGQGDGADPGPTAIRRLVLEARREGGLRPSLLHCHDASSEARAVVDHVLELHESGVRLRDEAVLVRAAHHSDLIELELSARRVPYRKYGGLRFLETAHVKDFVAAGRLLDNPADDVAWYRVLRVHEGIGPARARHLLRTLPPRRPSGPESCAETVAAAPASARIALGATMEALARAREIEGAAARGDAILAMLRPLVSSRYTDAAARLRDLERLASAAATAGDFGSWLAELTLDPPESTSDFAGPPRIDEDFVVVSTIHSAKGLEWRAVHVPHLVDGAFPSDMALRSSAGLAEELRLFYVALTRARDELHLYAPVRMPHHRRAADDRHVLTQHSRFIDSGLLALLAVGEQGAPRARLAPGVDQQTGEIRLQRAEVAAALDLGSLFG